MGNPRETRANADAEIDISAIPGAIELARVKANKPERTPDWVTVPFSQLKIADFDRLGGTMLPPDDTGKVVVENAEGDSRLVLWEDAKGLHGLYHDDGFPKIFWELDNRRATIGDDRIELTSTVTPDLALGSSYDPAETFIFRKGTFGTPRDLQVAEVE
jgi:hypothetical protein